uniref:Peptidase S74 domain-containing protein n=1 Tax=Globisporangium ultimum (strain ATCC 200006 / CBS 805.95 / DAOM BR144) TaxID=431595 RepID=K3WM48_GLOUD
MFVTYEWRRDEFPSRRFAAGRFAGFLADEVQQILPQSVREDGEGWLSLDYSSVIPYLVRAAQEMQTDMQKMQSEIDDLKARVQTLETLLSTS